MHPYGIDSNERRNILVFLVVSSFLLSELFGRIAATLGWVSPAILDWMFDPASAAAWFAILFYLFEHYVWRWKLLHRAKLVQLPNLNGSWTGTLKSSYDNFAKTHDIVITVKQTWSRLIVELATEQSGSKSETGSVYVNKASQPILVYTYLNIPNPNQLESMAIHAGTTTLELQECNEGMRLTGHYYSGRGRGNYGEITLSKSE